MSATNIRGTLGRRLRDGVSALLAPLSARRAATSRTAVPALDDLPGLALMVDTRGRVVAANGRALAYFGVSGPQEMTWTRLVHADDLEALDAHWRAPRGVTEPFELEFRARRADGGDRWVRARFGPQGRNAGWCGLVEDIHERRDAERSLEARESELRLILDSIPALIHTLTPDGQIEFVNRRVLEFFGLPAEELRDWSTVTHPEDIARVHPILEHSLRTGEPFAVESRGRRADGHYRWLDARGLPLRDASGAVVRWYHVLTDVDDRRRAEDALRASVDELRLAVDSIPGLICTNTPEGDVELVNKTLLDYTGRTLSELRNWSIVVHPDDLPGVARRWSLSIATGAPFNVEVRVLRADGAYRWFLCRGLPLRAADGRVLRWYNLLTDIEDLRLAQETLRSTQSRLTRAAQVATVGEVAASIAHEINQPLAAVVANAEACERWLSGDPPNLVRARSSVESIVRNGTNAGEVIRRIRALYRKAAPCKEPLDVNEVVTEVCLLLEGELRRREISLRLELASSLRRTPADRVQLQQLLANLVRNAIDAMESAAERELRIVSRQEGARTFVEVCDTGIGLPAGVAVFEPFFTTKPSGMGMGLAICRSIVEAHGGELRAEPAVPCGARFSFSLPQDDAEA